MRRQRGAVTIEFTLVAIPLIFILISTVEISRGAWTYATEAYAVNAGARYVAVHGVNCTTGGNSCGTTVGSIAQAIANAGPGLTTSQWNVTLYSASGTNNQSCNPLNSCFGNATVWPPAPDNTVGTGIAVAGSYPFTSALAMFWPGTPTTQFGQYNLPAYSRHLIQF